MLLKQREQIAPGVPKQRELFRRSSSFRIGRAAANPYCRIILKSRRLARTRHPSAMRVVQASTSSVLVQVQ
jgi:hypothetical protein